MRSRNVDAPLAWLGQTDQGAASGANALERLRSQVDELRFCHEVATTLEAIASRSMGVITAYLAGELPPDLAAEVTEILRTTPMLRAAHRQLLAAWQAPTAEHTVTEAEVEAAYARFKAARAAGTVTPVSKRSRS